MCSSAGRRCAAVAALVLVVAGWALGAPRAASAHALLRHSDPEGGAVLPQAPNAVTLTFTEQPETSLSAVHVLDGSGRPVEQAPAQAVAGDPLQLRVPVPRLPQGVYTVSWRTVSRVDGHVTGGAFAFGIGVTPSASQATGGTSPPPTPLSVAAKWALYAGLSGLLGAAWVWTLTVPPPGPAAWNGAFLLVAWALAAVGIVLLAIDQAATAGVSLGRLLGTPLGQTLWARALAIVAAGVALAWARALPPLRRRLPLAVSGLAAAAAMFAHVLGGHAAASGGMWRWANVADQWVHFAAVGTWIGGLAALLVMVRGAPDAGAATAARRFSLVAGVTLGILAAAGILRAVAEVGRWDALLSTDFGRLVLLKAAILLVVAWLGAVNRFRNVPAAGRTLVGLRRIGGAELALAAVVLATTALLTGFAPPSLSQEPARPAAVLHVSGNDFATSVRVRMEISPGLPGVDDFIAHITDYDTGRPVAASSVALRFDKPDRPDIGASTLAMVRRPDGTYEGRGANLSFDGPWNVTMTIQQAATSTSVPLIVNVPSPPLVVRTIEAPGQPTLYSISLPAGRVLNMYLDPGRPGFNEVHETFIGANGNELPVPRLAVITAGRPGSVPRRLPVRRFGPGHFIGDATLPAGDWEIAVAATARDGSGLQARVVVHLK